jgi:hypothetical protein
LYSEAGQSWLRFEEREDVCPAGDNRCAFVKQESIAGKRVAEPGTETLRQYGGRQAAVSLEEGFADRFRGGRRRSCLSGDEHW